jgi:hypothetical protein
MFIRVKEEKHSDIVKESERLTKSKLYTKKITNAIKSFLVSYTNSYNKMYGLRGNLFMQKIRRVHVNSDEYFKNLINYIHMNPVYHNFVQTPEDWKYSSYNSFFTSKPSKIDKITVLKYFDDLENFKYFHDLKKMEKFAKDMELLY